MEGSVFPRIDTSGDSCDYGTGIQRLIYTGNKTVKTLGLETLCVIFPTYHFCYNVSLKTLVLKK
jgi:hypothetical protein